MLVGLVPDEFQVHCELYETLVPRVDDRILYDRDYPQSRIVEFCRRNSIELLDLLEPLRRENTLQRVYHLRDTHWNARGNRVAGEAIAAFILERLTRRGPEC